MVVQHWCKATIFQNQPAQINKIIKVVPEMETESETERNSSTLLVKSILSGLLHKAKIGF